MGGALKCLPGRNDLGCDQRGGGVREFREFRVWGVWGSNGVLGLGFRVQTAVLGLVFRV